MPEKSDEYRFIFARMSERLPFYAYYPEDDDVQRTLCAHVIGYKREGSSETTKYEVVLCYQVEPADEEGWRCFDIEKFNIEDMDDEDQHPGEGFWHTPEDFSNSKHQNSVQKVKYIVDAP
jgi:hypothetical protein